MGTGLGMLLPAAARPPVTRFMHWLKRDRKLNAKRRRRAYSGKKVLVAGLFGTTTGLGRAAELIALTLESRGSEVVRWDITAAVGEPVSREHVNPELPSDCTDVVCVFNPTLRGDMTFPLEWLNARCVVGHWIYEVETVPNSWAQSFRLYDEIWAPTEYVRSAIASVIKQRIKVVPYGAALDPMPRAIRNDTPGFVVGYSFAVNSCYYRKNPEDAVRAFKLAFPEDTNVKLYLRSNDLDDRPIERDQLRATIADDPRITIFDKTNRIGLQDFYNSIDVYLSPSKAEGYGLNLVEAAQAGIPVICNGWRLPTEIELLPGVTTVDYQLEPLEDPQGSYADVGPSRWAAPDIAEMAAQLVRVHARNGSVDQGCTTTTHSAIAVG
jgi:glycosyltransferase involved in cell wall biosynthesis